MRVFCILFAFSVGLLVWAGSSPAATFDTSARINIVSGSEALIARQPASGMDRFSLSGPAEQWVNIQMTSPGSEMREFSVLADTKGMLQLEFPVAQPSGPMYPTSDFIISVVYE